jgi:hypothetical protein
MAMFVNAEALDFGFQGCSRNSKPGGSTVRTGNPALTLRQCSFNDLSFPIRYGRSQGGRARWLRPRWLRPQPSLLHDECFRIAKDDCPLNHVLKFPDISRPVTCLEELCRPLLHPSKPFESSCGIAFDEILCKKKDVFGPLAKRRNVDWENVQAIEEVQTKSSGMNGVWQIAIGSCYDTNVDRDALGAPYSLELAFLKHAQQGDLGFARHLTDLIEKNRPVVRDFEAPGMTLIGAGEGAFLVAKELGRNQ